MSSTAFDNQYLAAPAPAMFTDEQWWVDQLDTITGCFEKLTMDQYRAVHIARQFIKSVLASVLI